MIDGEGGQAPERLSIVIPVYNEEQNIPPLFEALKTALDVLPDIVWGVIFVNDGSHDQSLALIQELARGDARVKYLELSRNFGKEAAPWPAFSRSWPV